MGGGTDDCGCFSIGLRKEIVAVAVLPQAIQGGEGKPGVLHSQLQPSLKKHTVTRVLSKEMAILYHQVYCSVKNKF